VCQEDEPDNISRNYLIQFLLWLLGRLADNLRWQYKDLGGDILSDATNSTLLMASIGVLMPLLCMIFLTAQSTFMSILVFDHCLNPMDLMISLKEAETTLYSGS